MDEEKTIPAVIGEYHDYTSFEWAGTQGRKKSWVPWWLWDLVSVPCFPISDAIAAYNKCFQESDE